jgi:hypothetical protein
MIYPEETGSGGGSGESHSIECPRCKAVFPLNLSGKRTEQMNIIEL